MVQTAIDCDCQNNEKIQPWKFQQKLNVRDVFAAEINTSEVMRSEQRRNYLLDKRIKMQHVQ